MFFERLEAFGSATALVDESGRAVAYAELAGLADSVARQLGPRRGVVAILCRNSVAGVVAWLGALRGGHVPLLVDGELDPGLADRLLAPFPVSALLDADTSALEPILRPMSSVPCELHDQLGALLSTSGSTGSPKLVRLSTGNLQANAAAIAAYLSLEQDDRAILGLPVHYSYGLSVLNSHLALGACLVLTTQPVTARGFWDALRTHAVTSLAAVPTTWEMLRRLRFERMELPSLRYCTQAGGRLGIDHARHFGEWAASTGRRFYVMYGQTEATARISYVPPERLLAKLGSIGIALPGGTLEVHGDTGPLPTGSEGELCFRGPNVMLGYAECAEDLALGDERSGFLRTGDLGRMDDDGYFHVTGRLKRMIKVFGLRLSLDEVEKDLQSHGHECAAVGEDDRLTIAVVGEEVEHLRALVCRRFRLHPSVVRVARVAELPRTSAGKVRYADLSVQLAERESQ